MTIRHIPAVNTPYAHIINAANSEWYNADTTSFETFDAGNIADYAVAAGSQFGTTGIWPWEFPSGIAAGQYTVLIYDGDDDSLVDAGVVDWDGAALNVAADVRKVTGTAVANVDDFKATGFLTTLGTNAPANWINAAAISSNAFTTAKFADGVFTAAKFASGAFDAVWSVTTRALTATGLDAITAWAVAITGNITGNLSGSVGSVTAAVETDSASRTASKATAGEIRDAVGLGSANLDTQLSGIGTDADVSAGILATLTEDSSGLRFTEKALEEAPTGSGGGGDDAATIYSYFADGSRPDVFKADVSGLSTYDGSDTSGTTTLLSRLSAARAGYLDKLNVSGVLAHTDNATSFMADVSLIPNTTAFEARTLPTADYATLSGQGVIAGAIDDLVEPPDEETIAAAVLGFDVTTIEDAAVLYSLATTIMQKLNATVVGSNLQIRKSDGSLMHERQFTSDSNAEPVTGIGDVA